MKLTTIVLSSVLTLGSTLAFAQGASSGDAAAAGGATGGPAGAGSSSAIKSDKMDPSDTRDSAQGYGFGQRLGHYAGGATGGPAGAGSSNAIKSDTTGSSKGPRAANNEVGLSVSVLYGMKAFRDEADAGIARRPAGWARLK